jgi:hypothetical protein
MLGFAALFTSLSRLSKYAREKPFPQPFPGICSLFFIQF